MLISGYHRYQTRNTITYSVQIQDVTSIVALVDIDDASFPITNNLEAYKYVDGAHVMDFKLALKTRFCVVNRLTRTSAKHVINVGSHEVKCIFGFPNSHVSDQATKTEFL